MRRNKQSSFTNKTEFSIVFLIVGIATFLRFFQLNELMMFIGDFGWFYLSARDVILTHSVPLVGITASHTWLHQGPFWTYLLAIALFISHFNPLSGAYFTAFIGVLTTLLMYYVGVQVFNQKVAVISAFLYATSPLVIIHSRMPYHTSLIPLFSLLYFYFFWKWVKGSAIASPLTIFMLTILYNFELATQVLWFPLLLYLLYGFWKKQKYVRSVLSKKIIMYSLAALIIPMIPILVYDSTHGFPQTIKYAAWILYHLVTAIGFPAIHSSQSSSIQEMINFLVIFIERLVFLPNQIIAVLFIILSVTMIIIQVYKARRNDQNLLLLTLTVSCLLGIIASKTTSEAYLPMSFPYIIFMIGVSFSTFFKRQYKFLMAIVIALIGIINAFSLLQQNYLMGANMPYGLSFTTRQEAAKTIVNLANGKKYNLVGKGPGSQFASYTMNYEYLTWLLGNPPSKQKQKVIITVNETPGGVNLGVIKKEL